MSGVLHAATAVMQMRAPTYSSINNSALTSGASRTITGTNFYPGGTSVLFNGSAGSSVSVTSSTSLTVTVPNLSTAQNVNIAITTPGGTVTANGAAIFYGVPTVTAVSPTSGKTGDSLTVTGTNITASGSPTATVGGVAATITGTSGNTQFTVTVPTITDSGTKNVTYTNPGGTGTGTSLFTYYAAPTYTSVSPSSGKTGDTITVTGTNFTSGGSPTVTVGGVSASFTVTSATQLSITVPTISTSGTKNIVYTNPGGSATGTNAFTYTAAPTVTGVSPPQGPPGTVVTFTGTNFVSGSTTATIANGVALTNISVASATSMTGTIPTQGTGEGVKLVTITTPGGSVGANFTYYNTTAAVTTTYTTVGSGTYTIPAWCSFVDIICIGGGQGGGNATGAGTGWGGLAGSWNGGTFSRSTNWATTTLSYTVGGGGLGGTVDNDTKAGDAGGNSSGGSVTANGASSTGRNTSATGASPGNYTFNSVTYTGGAAVNNAAGNPPGGGGYGGTFGGNGFNGARGQVWFVARQ